MIYFILLTSLALATCYLACHWRKHDGVSASQATGLLVHSFTCPLTMLLCLLFTLSTNNWLTCPLVDLSTKKILYLAFSINFAIFANYLIHMYHMFVEIIDILYYEFKL